MMNPSTTTLKVGATTTTNPKIWMSTVLASDTNNFFTVDYTSAGLLAAMVSLNKSRSVQILAIGY